MPCRRSYLSTDVTVSVRPLVSMRARASLRPEDRNAQAKCPSERHAPSKSRELRVNEGAATRAKQLRPDQAVRLREALRPRHGLTAGITSVSHNVREHRK